jgi:hypothetical protein
VKSVSGGHEVSWEDEQRSLFQSGHGAASIEAAYLKKHDRSVSAWQLPSQSNSAEVSDEFGHQNRKPKITQKAL